MSDEDFACFHCQFQPPDPWLTDKDEDGEEYYLLEQQNEKRYEHYLRDFGDGDYEELKLHLERRIRYLMRGDKTKVDAAMQTVGPTLDWWKIAKKVRRDGKPTTTSPFVERLRAEYQAKKAPEPPDETTEKYNREKARKALLEAALAE